MGCYDEFRDKCDMLRHFVRVHPERASDEEKAKYTRKDKLSMACSKCHKKMQEASIPIHLALYCSHKASINL